MNVRKFDNVRKDIAYIPRCPQYCIAVFRGTMFSIWCSTCIVRPWQKDVRHWLLQGD